MEKLFEYSIPQKGNVTKKNTSDLYNLTKLLETYNSFKLTGSLIGILLNDDTKKIKKLQGIVKEPTIEATYKQKKALNRIIFGKHYTVKTYMELMEMLVRLEDIEYCKKEHNPLENIMDPLYQDNKTREKNTRKSDEDPAYFYTEKILPFLWNIARDISDNKLEKEKILFKNDLKSIIQSI